VESCVGHGSKSALGDGRQYRCKKKAAGACVTAGDDGGHGGPPHPDSGPWVMGFLVEDKKM
jgi:hypothetical protein